MLKRTGALLLVILGAGLYVYREPTPAAGESQSQPSPASAAARQAIEQLAHRANLRLASTGPSAADRFCFCCYLQPPTDSGRQAVNVLVERDNAALAVLVVGKDGLTYAYVTDGLLLMLDPQNPGCLVSHHGGRLQFSFGGANGRANGELQYTARGTGSSVVADPAAILGSMLQRVSRAELEPDKATIHATTKKGAHVTITLATGERETGYPIDSLFIEAPTGMALAFTRVRLNPSSGWRITSSVLDARKLAIPIRSLTDEEVGQFSPLPAADFGWTPAERAAAAKLRELFHAEPATQPEKQVRPAVGQ
jgi:hypothetical protein